MPKGLVKTAHDEAAWSRAKSKVREEYSDIDEDSDHFWALTNTLYQSMRKGFGDRGDVPPFALPARRLGQRPSEETNEDGQETQNATGMRSIRDLVKSESSLDEKKFLIADQKDEEEGVEDYNKQADYYDSIGEHKKARILRLIAGQEAHHKQIVEKLQGDMDRGFGLPVGKSTKSDLVKSYPLANADWKPIYDYLKQNYPAETLTWVKNDDWKYCSNIPLDEIHMDRRPDGRNQSKVEFMAEAIKSGKKMDPVVLVGNSANGYDIADGYHRTLAYKHAGRDTIAAYIYIRADEHGPWEKEMHQKKLNKALQLLKSLQSGQLTEDQLLEKLAESIHNMWMGWAVHASESVDPEIKERWNKMFMPYSDLPEEEKQKDRIEAIAFLDLVRQRKVKKGFWLPLSKSFEGHSGRPGKQGGSLPKGETPETATRAKMPPMGGKPYWSSNCEMFARVFESYIQDKMREGGRDNNYLVSGTKGMPGTPFPRGDERNMMHDALEGLLDIIVSKGAIKKALSSESQLKKSLALTHVPAPNMVWSALHQASIPMQMQDDHTAKVPGAIVTVSSNGQVAVIGPKADEIMAILQVELSKKQTSEDWIDGHQTLTGGGFFLPVFQGVCW